MREFVFSAYGIDFMLVSNTNIDVYKHFPPAEKPEIRLFIFEGPYDPPSFSEEEGRLVITTPTPSGHLLRQCVAFLVGYYSEGLDPLHGAGVIINDKGVAFVGNRKAGKSSIAASYPRNNVIDDDLLITNHTNISSVGFHGSVTLHDGETKRLLYLMDNPVNHTLDRVFLLNNRLPGGTAQEKSRSIPRNYAIIDALPQSLIRLSLELGPIPVSCPVYEIGTCGGLEKTIECIDRCMDN
jgi:hypothetical protein